ncbi:MAG TPA: HAMP domain-containing sensor histidine kinase [Solirubrobacteraceae bacterium]|nr:HAMP domain-containing sensor histidine kinase [Solirubrobacteraceae bacterium]
MTPDKVHMAAGAPYASYRRPWWRRSFGLRPRLVLALVLTAAVTLGVAALALLSPLQDRLRAQAERNLRAAALTARPGFEDAAAEGVGVRELARVLQRRTGASRVVVDDQVFGDERLADTAAAGTPDRQIEEAILRTLRLERTTLTSGPDGTTVAVPLNVPGITEPYVLAVRRTRDDAAAVVTEVREAFLTAALVGLAVAVLLGLAVVTTLLRRLERLRGVARRIATDGPQAAAAPVDNSGDEVGDLARTLAAMQHGLQRQETARRTFVATASHELRTPLTSLGGTLELLAEDLRDGRVDLADAQEQIALAQNEVGRLTHLATDLLDLSRLDSDQPLRHEPVELEELSRAVGAEFTARARELDVELDVRSAPGPCWGLGDPGALARILRIMLDNALRFAPRGTTVRITPAYHGESATIGVADAGPGVPDHERDLIFERFRRGSATGGEGGFGLGLAIGRELAQRLGGELTLDSPNGAGPLQGARFVLSVPIEQPAGSRGQ